MAFRPKTSVNEFLATIGFRLALIANHCLLFENLDRGFLCVFIYLFLYINNHFKKKVIISFLQSNLIWTTKVIIKKPWKKFFEIDFSPFILQFNMDSFEVQLFLISNGRCSVLKYTYRIIIIHLNLKANLTHIYYIKYIPSNTFW